MDRWLIWSDMVMFFRTSFLDVFSSSTTLTLMLIT